MANLSSYRNKYGGRVFVCGNAPSLAADYPKLENEHTFACNFLPAWEGLPFPPTFYGVTEPTDHEGQWEFVDRISRGISHRFVLGRAKPQPWRKRWTYVPKIQPNGQSGHLFQEGVRTGPPFATAGTTPLNVGVQVAAYMGFDEIYVLGVELTDGHVYEVPENGLGKQVMGKELAQRGWGAGRQQGVVKSFARASADLAARGVSLVNCTPTGVLKDSFGCTPVEQVL